MLYGTLPQIAAHLRRTNHYLFAGRFIGEALSVLGDMNRYIMDNPAVTGFTFTAWMVIPETCEHIKTNITIDKTYRGWMVTESIA